MCTTVIPALGGGDSRSDVQGHLWLHSELKTGLVMWAPASKTNSSGDGDATHRAHWGCLALHVIHWLGETTAFGCLAFCGEKKNQKGFSLMYVTWYLYTHTVFLVFSKYVWIFVVFYKVVWCIVFYHQKTLLFSVKHYTSYLNSAGGAGLAFTELLSTWGLS